MPEIHVVHVITALRRGGAETMLAKLLEVMTCERFRQTVVVLQDKGDTGRPNRAGRRPGDPAEHEGRFRSSSCPVEMCGLFVGSKAAHCADLALSRRLRRYSGGKGGWGAHG